MNYNQLNTLLQGRCHHRRKLANNTIAIRRGPGIITIRLHNTDILTFCYNGSVIYNTGGWRTVTTKQRLNAFGPQHVYISQSNFNWFVRDHNTAATYPFEENLCITLSA